jgi:hypothetical protein
VADPGLAGLADQADRQADAGPRPARAMTPPALARTDTTADSGQIGT